MTSSSSSSISISGRRSRSRQLQKRAEAAIKAWAATAEQGAALVAPRLVAKDAPWRLHVHAPRDAASLLTRLYDAVLKHPQKRARAGYPGLFNIVHKHSITTSEEFEIVLDMLMVGFRSWRSVSDREAGLVADKITAIWLDLAITRLGQRACEEGGGEAWGGAVAPGGAAGLNRLGGTWPCMLCPDLVKEERMREHVAAHMLAGHVPKDMLTRTCGCCGQQGCTPLLIKPSAKTAVRPHVQCRAGYFRAWIQGWTGKDGARCTNTPIACALCTTPRATAPAAGDVAPEDGPFFWKYAMEQHAAEAHGGQAGPPHGQPGSWVIGPKEMAHMLKVAHRVRKPDTLHPGALTLNPGALIP